MSREPRKTSEARSTLEDALRRFEGRPVALPGHIVSGLLDELCGEFGLCLTRADYKAVEAQPPTNPRAFAEVVAKFEGLDPDDDFFSPVLQLVLRTFEGAAQDSTV